MVMLSLLFLFCMKYLQVRAYDFSYGVDASIDETEEAPHVVGPEPWS